jgi:hypothetical protein
MQSKSLILFRGMIRDLLQVPDDVTGCFSVVTTTLPPFTVANMPKRLISDGGDTRRCENVRRAARRLAPKWLQE